MASVIKDEEAALAKERATLEQEEVVSERLDKALDELDALTHARDEISSQLKESLTLMHDQREELEGIKESHVLKKRELEEFKVKVVSLEKELERLKDENEDICSFVRLTARAAIMRCHLSGKDPLVSAQRELDAYLNGVGSERDLDLDDEKDADEEMASEDLQDVVLDKDVVETPSLP